MKKYFVLSIALTAMICIFTGCVANKEIGYKDKKALVLKKKKRIKNTLPTCHSKSECEIKWAAAKKWVNLDPRRKVKYHTDSFIETHMPPLDSTELAVQIVKVGLPQGGYKIVINTKCYHEYGCIPSKEDAEIDFNNYINSGKEEKTAFFNQQPANLKTKVKGGALKKLDEYKGKSNLSLPDLPDSVSLPKQ